MPESEPFFWMGGKLAYDLQEMSSDPSSLDQEGFWALSTTFEGEFTCARFGKVVAAPMPSAGKPWINLSQRWLTSLSRQNYLKYVGVIQEKIAEGWVYQVCACRQLSTSLDGDSSLIALMGKMLRENPAPYSSFLRLPGLEIASASPELFFERNNNEVKSGPIKGTKRLDSPEKKFNSKEEAENIMIVDLIRNDLSKICAPGSIHVPRLLVSEEHPGLAHLVSDVSGTLREGVKWGAISEALLPPGSVSGAPKSTAISTIEQLEGQSRGPYCGALGWVEGDFALLSEAIRIFWSTREGSIHFGTGAGITWGSEPLQEWDETQLKAERLLSIAGGEL